jgi:hypothetical protein
MNVLLCHDNAIPGGLETRLLVHAALLKARGHRVIAARNPGLMSAAFEAAGVEEIPFDFQKREAFDQTVMAMRALIRAERIDFCDLHPFWSLLPGALAALAEGVPFAFNVHGLHQWDTESLLLRHTLALLWPHAAMATASSPATREFFLAETPAIDPARFACVP